MESNGTTPLAEGEGPDKPPGRLGRRALMLGAAAGVGGAAALVAGASPAGAANGDAVTVGGSFTGTDPTEITNTTGTGIYGVTDAASQLSGTAGVVGDSNSNDGVLGLSSAADGVHGITTRGGQSGVYGDDQSTGGYGVYGYSFNATGVQGQSIGASGLAAPSAGVIGDSNANDGVSGFSSAGNGVSGYTSAEGGSGVLGVDDSGKSISSGVTAYSKSGSGLGAGTMDGVAVIATTEKEGIGSALVVEGVASFTRSGVATLSAAATSVVVTVPGGLKTTSHVLATLQTDSGAATLAIHAAVPDVGTGKVTIYFTASAPKDTKAAWFVFG